jgi:hypothetical protein
VTTGRRLTGYLWIAVGTGLLLAVALLVLHYQHERTPDQQLAFQARPIVDRMSLALVSASEAEKSAVMAIADEESETFANQAREATVRVEQGHRELAELLERGGTGHEKKLLEEFSEAFTEFQRIDNHLLSLAVSNTNIKASRLAFGPAAAALDEMDTALARIVTQNSPSPDTIVVGLADDARIAALRIQTLLPPHIAEESEQRMDRMEYLMAQEDRRVHESLDELAAMEKLTDDPNLTIARSSYARFSDTKTQILKLSRENTNVRSLPISLNQKRKIMVLCLDALDNLRNAIEQGETRRAAVSPQ